MPWEAVATHPECEGPAVVKSDTGELVACHSSMESAQQQVAALYAQTGEGRSGSGAIDITAFWEGLAAVPNLRSAQFTDVEMVEEGKGFRYRGHAAVFDEVATLTEIPGIGTATEEIKRGAFRKVLAQPRNIPLTLEHDRDKVLATTGSRTLRLSEDAKGLAVDATLPDTSLARDLKALVDADVVKGMSFGFVAGPQSTGNWTVERRSNGIHRVLSGFKRLLDVCATWDPTYPSATAQFRSLAVQYADDPALLQQILLGAHPAQLEDGAEEEEAATTGSELEPDSAATGAAEHRNRSVAARRRALSLIVLETGGIDDHAS